MVDVNLIEVPDPRHATKDLAKKLRGRLRQALPARDASMVEEEFMGHSANAQRNWPKPVRLPTELQDAGPCALDLAVFELLGVADAKEREALCNELYRDTARISAKSALSKCKSRTARLRRPRISHR